MGTSTTDSSCHCDICPGNICPGYICPYQQYISCYWLDFDQTSKARHLSSQHMSMSVISQLLLAQFTKKVLAQNFFQNKSFFPKKNLRPMIFLDQNYFGSTFFGPKFFWTSLQAEHFRLKSCYNSTSKVAFWLPILK